MKYSCEVQCYANYCCFLSFKVWKQVQFYLNNTLIIDKLACYYIAFSVQTCTHFSQMFRPCLRWVVYSLRHPELFTKSCLIGHCVCVSSPRMPAVLSWQHLKLSAVATEVIFCTCFLGAMLQGFLWQEKQLWKFTEMVCHFWNMHALSCEDMYMQNKMCR